MNRTRVPRAIRRTAVTLILLGPIIAPVAARAEPPATPSAAPAKPARANPDVAVEDLAPLLAPIRAKHDVPALCAALLRHDRVVAIGVDGVRRRGDATKATTDDLWHLGSCTKSMTATLVAKLVQWVRPRVERLPVATIAAAGRDAARQPVSAHVLDGIPGLDVKLGLHLVMDRDALYLSIMEKFVEGQADAPARIGAAIAAADWPTAEREAHTLKGVSAQIGAGDLRGMAEQLERAIRGREPVARLDELRAGVAAALGSLIGAIAERLPKAAPVVAASSVDPAALRELCVRLAGLLRDDDFASGKLLGDNAAMLRAAFGDRYREISEAVRQYDFAIALDRLERAAESLGIAVR